MVSRLFRIQYVSDLHLEFYDKLAFPLLVKPAARYLVLAGDIGQPSHPLFRSFMEYVSGNWDRVFYVAGNHEYYNMKKERRQTMSGVQDAIHNVIYPYKNVHFLHPSNPHVYMSEQNVAIIGTTLWTHISDDMIVRAQRGMNDYNYIDAEPSKRLHPHDVNRLHAAEKQLLEEQIMYWTFRKANICVITHHMPSYSLISQRYADFPLNACFASACESLMTRQVRAWIYGHTHTCGTQRIRDTMCHVNARGYPNETVRGFTPDTWYEFSCRDDTDGCDAELSAAAASSAAVEDIEFM